MSLIKGCGLGPVEASTGHVGWWTRVHYPTCPVKFPLDTRRVLNKNIPKVLQFNRYFLEILNVNMN